MHTSPPEPHHDDDLPPDDAIEDDSPTDEEILTAYTTTTAPLPDLARALNIPLLELTSRLEQPHMRAALRAVRRAHLQRARDLTAAALPRAVEAASRTLNSNNHPTLQAAARAIASLARRLLHPSRPARAAPRHGGTRLRRVSAEANILAANIDPTPCPRVACSRPREHAESNADNPPSTESASAPSAPPPSRVLTRCPRRSRLRAINRQIASPRHAQPRNTHQSPAHAAQPQGP